jgi:iron uptake system component EfeO
VPCRSLSARSLPLAAVALLPVLLVACGGGDESSAESSRPVTAIAVESSDTDCLLDALTAPEGQVAFAVKNTGTSVTEFYVLRSDGSIVIEVEDIGPGLSADLELDMPAGDYVARCKPGMSGDGIDVDFAVDAA